MELGSAAMRGNTMHDARRFPFAVSACVFSLLLWACAGNPAPRGGLPTTPGAGADPASTQAAAAAVAAGQAPVSQGPALPLDARVKRGVLPNGLTYYVLPHKKPEKRAQLWLAVNAGSILEDDDQQGLAHFLEHMGFNGTKRFPKQDIVNFVEKAGMRFGPHLNAYTSFDETVYMLQVPTDAPELMDKGFQVLRDWAGDVSLDSGEVEKERGVVLEEWRLGRGAGMRLFEKQGPVIFSGSKYAKRLPIGKPEIIKGAPRDTLARFYKDWYRPDLMAVIAVGDFDGAAVEKQIAAEFGSLPRPATPRPRALEQLPRHGETLVTIETDPEMPMTTVGILNKLPARPKRSEADYRRMLAEQLYHSMLNGRLDELRRKPDAPFVQAGSGTSGMVRSADVFSLQAVAKEGKVEAAAEALLEELARVERHGFTNTELDRAKKRLLRSARQAVTERDKQEARQFTAEIVRHFLQEETMPGPEGELVLTEKLLPSYTAAELSQLAKGWVSGASRVVSIQGPDKMKKPEASQIQAIAQAVEKKDIKAYDDAQSAAPLLAAAPKPGKVVATRTVPEVGVTEWKLSNGAKVVIKPTNFKNDEFRISGFSPGGHSLVKDADYDSARFSGDIVQQAGLGPMDAVSLRKALSGKIVYVNSFVGELEEYVGAGGSPEDMQTAFELIYLAFTAPRKDEGSFKSWQQRETEQVRNRRLSPERVFQEDMQLFMSQNHRRRQPTTPEVVEKVSLERALAVYQDRFKEAGDFTFVIVGNVDLDKLRPLVETYLASLPARGRKERWRDINVKWPRGKQSKTVVKGTEPKSRVMLSFLGNETWSREKQDDMEMLSQVLQIRLRETLREEMGGVYGVGAGGGISRRPKQRYTFTVSFGCAPENVDKLKQKVLDEIAALQKNGIGEDYLDKVRQTRKRQHEINMKENGFWQSELEDAWRYGEDPKKIPEIDPWIARVSSDRVKAAARRYLHLDAYVQGTLNPEPGAKPATPPPPAKPATPPPAASRPPAPSGPATATAAGGR
jgi:zinc protease